MKRKGKAPTSDLDRILGAAITGVKVGAGVSIAGAAISNIGSTMRRVN